MSRKAVLVDCVGLTPSMLGPDAPHLTALAKGGFSAPLDGVLPAVTCSAQTSILTGTLPREHGIVGNGWYFRDLSQVWLWRQSNRLVQAENVWDRARRADPSFTVCNMFWWYNMVTSADWSLTPRPLYFADGRKMPGIYGRPTSFRSEIEAALPPFPLFKFWGPAAGLESSEWIVDASILAFERVDPTLGLVYVPHLDYDLQRFGPSSERTRERLREVDACVGRLIEFAERTDRDLWVVSEYGLVDVSAPVHVNRALREAGFLETSPQLDTENLDPGASRAFAVADHQVAHVYVADPADVAPVRRVLEDLDGVERVLGADGKREHGLDHPRSGELIAIAERERWFTYYFWLDDRRAPDYARCVDIHSKPGYDPAELLLDPELSAPKLKIAWRLLQKTLGFRMTMDVIPLDAGLVRGSHGRLPDSPDEGAVIISSRPAPHDGPFAMTDVAELLLDGLLDR